MVKNWSVLSLAFVGALILFFPINMWILRYDATEIALRFFDLALIGLGSAMITVAGCSLHYVPDKKQESTKPNPETS